MPVDARRTSVHLEGLEYLMPVRDVPQIGSPYFEATTRRLLLQALPKGGVFVDVGAHVGTMALPAARHVGPGGRVHAVEPAPANAATLAENAELNGLANITVHSCAAGAEADTRPFHLMDFSFLNGFVQHGLGQPVATVEVPVRRLDELIDERVDVVKIDVEGAELDVLAGMSGLFERNPEMVLCVEWNPLTMNGRDPLLLLDALAEFGYRNGEVVEETNRGRRRPLEHAWPAIAAGRMPPNWWGNLIVRKEAP